MNPLWKYHKKYWNFFKGSMWNNLLFDLSDSYLTIFPSHSFWLFYSKYCSLRVPSFLFLFVLNACILPSFSFFTIRHKCLPLPQLLCVGQSLVKDAFLASEPLDLQLEQADVFDPLLVVKVPLAQDWLLDSDLLIQQCTLVIAMQQLLAQAVPLSDHLKRAHNQNLFLYLSTRLCFSFFTCSSCFFCWVCSASASDIIFCSFCCSVFWLSTHCFVSSSCCLISCSSACRKCRKFR